MSKENLENLSNGVASAAVGQYVIVRSRIEGINAGFVAAADGTGVILNSARRLRYHKPNTLSESWYEGVANHGVSDDTQISGTVIRKIIIEDYSITFCTEKAQKSLMSAKPYAQS